jgi:hypothetical protein
MERVERIILNHMELLTQFSFPHLTLKSQQYLLIFSNITPIGKSQIIREIDWLKAKLRGKATFQGGKATCWKN